MPESRTLEHSTIVLLLGHNQSQCEGRPCTVHSMSNHNMRSFPQHWRSDIGIMERINPFGGACPDPDNPWPPDDPRWVHGCVVNPYSNVGMCQEWTIDGVEAAWLSDSYAVTVDGRVWSFQRSLGPRQGNQHKPDYTKEPRELAPRANNRGYMRVGLGRKVDFYVHRLVLSAWRGPAPAGMEARHLDGSKSNNALDNLMWGTHDQNDSDKDAHGTRPLGSGHKNSRLQEDQVVEARMLWAAGSTLPEILDVLGLGVSRATLHDALIGRTWRHADGAVTRKRAHNDA